MASNKFLRNDGWFQQVDSASIVPSTAATGTGFLGSLTNSLSGNVTCGAAGYTTGPTVNQGSSGVWFASGQITLVSSTVNTQAFFQLFDGTTTIASASNVLFSGTQISVSLSGVIASPAGNIRMAVAGTTNVIMNFNVTGLSKDSTLTAIRIG